MRNMIGTLGTVLGAGAILAIALGATHTTAAAGSSLKARPLVELDEAALYIEWHATDDEFTLQGAWDSDGFTRMKLTNPRGRPVLALRAIRGFKRQGLAQAQFESLDAESRGEEAEEFLERFPEGEYTFKGRGAEGERLFATAELSHVIPARVRDVFPAEDDEVSHLGFTASFDPVTEDRDGNPIEIAFYVVVIEKDDEEPFLQTFEVVLAPTQTSVAVPAEFLEPDTDYAIEVIAHASNGNRTVTEESDFTTTMD